MLKLLQLLQFYSMQLRFKHMRCNQPILSCYSNHHHNSCNYNHNYSCNNNHSINYYNYSLNNHHNNSCNNNHHTLSLHSMDRRFMRGRRLLGKSNASGKDMQPIRM